jgi:RNA polymerase sigma factor (sigma-70 family)
VAKANKDNLEKLIVEYRPRLKSFIRARVDNVEDAEDILQDVFYQFAKTVDAAMNPVEQVAAWLYRVTRNTIINHGTKKREEKIPVYRQDDSDEEIAEEFSEVLFGESSPSPATEYLRSMVWAELELALAGLPPEQREIFELTEVDGIPVKEIAKTLNVPLNTLLSRKHYAVLYLREKLRDLYLEVIME